MSAVGPNFDAIVIGAGVAGLYQLHRLRGLGLSVRVFEAGGDLGGTWYWNRYPGCRFDSESYSYGYSFDDDILQGWEWSEHFSAQPETLRYLNFVADRLDLRRDIRFDSPVRAATHDEAANLWEVELADGERTTSWLLITAIGALSVPVLPAIEGLERFEGPVHHTGLWPHEPVDFTGKRVAVIGTGATGVQVIQEVAKTAGSLTVFQRTPNWCAPLHNRPIDDETQERIKATYPAIFELCRSTFGQFIHDSDPRNALDVTPEERLALYEKLYAAPGFGIWMANFRDVLIDEEANRTITEFMAGKVRERVHDPEVAERLIPRDHGFGTRRVPLETGYYEVYNQDNVELVDLKQTPIEGITPTGICTTAGDHEVDMIILATGFDAVTGAFDRIEFRGVGGRTAEGRVGGRPMDPTWACRSPASPTCSPSSAPTTRPPSATSLVASAERRVGVRPRRARLRAGDRPHRGDRGGRHGVDRARPRGGPADAVLQGRLVVHRGEHEPGGQTGAEGAPVRRWGAEAPAPL